MVIRIAVDQTLTDLSARIGRETLGRILKITSPSDTNVDVWRKVGTPFGPAYALTPVDESSVLPDVLYVSPGVKARFYPERDTIKIPVAG